MKPLKSLLILFCLISFNLFSQTNTKEKQAKKDNITDLAIQYLSAYSDWDVAKMKTFYSDSIHFKDPTAIEAFNSDYDVVGKEKVAAKFKSVFPDVLPEHVSFNIKTHFKSGTFVIINSTFELILPKSWYGDAASGKIFVSVPMITILRFKDQKIISHQDYVDYDSYNKQISFQLKKEKS